MSIYDTLNDNQRLGVETTEGPVLLLAGAGSGKTRVLTHRIAYLIEEENVNPWNILAITFTNKAAKEMRERVDRIVGFGAEQIWVSTFHSTCVRILRRYSDLIGYDTSFTIYDSDDQKTVIKDVCKRLKIDTKKHKEKTLLSYISSLKNELIDPKVFALNAQGEYNLEIVSKVYTEYQKTLHSNNAFDFDDLLCKTVELFKSSKEVLENYQNRFHYIMVDEYQDTNTVQFEFIRMLAQKNRNLCVVGDDDQSIYKFRGANIKNILDFEQVYPDAKVIKLEQNYRSTGNILAASNAVISNNKGRKGKILWTEDEDGQLLHFQQFDSAMEEASYIAETIRQTVRNGGFEYKDCAVLYRTNAQSRLIEERMVLLGVPYNLIGGVNFYQRREIKDILAYLKTIDNAKDDVAVKRVINIPKRGIGATSIQRVQEFADERNLSFYEALRVADQIPNIGKAASKMKNFITLIEAYRAKLEFYSIKELVDDILQGIGYYEYIGEFEEEEARDRLQNIDELINKITSYEEETEESTLSDLLSEISLVADIDNMDESKNKVVLMTLHGAKGLEFPHVIIAGMEDGVFPSYRAITSEDRADIEEERRLAYVGMTRAMKVLILTSARMRMTHGEVQYNKFSRFVSEIPEELLDHKLPKAKILEDERITERIIYREEPQDFDNRPKATIKTSTDTVEAKPFMAKTISDLNKVMGISKGKDTVKIDLDYKAGDRVSHVKFGQGTVLSIEETPRDYQVTVDFDKSGNKVMYASFAKLKRI